jgi:gluconate 2-dehydrogenase gamma chain
LIRRRTLLGAGVAAAAAGTAVTLPKWGNSPWRFFTIEEAAAVDAICEQLIPADGDPGAGEAHVVNYIDIQLTRHFRRYRQFYRQGIAAVEAASRARFSHGFAELTSDQRRQVLTGIAETSKDFFELILNHTRQGFYGDPRHGGNRNMASWKMLGLAYPQVRGRMHYGDQPDAG